jgi:putative transposase
MCVESQRTPFVTWRAFYARVMPRTPRERLPDGIYHVTQRGAGKIAIVRDDVDRLFYVFCLMDNHFHLVIETERSWLSGGMHRLGFLHAQRFNRRYERVGHLFQNRFGAVVIEDDDDLAAVCLYLLSNPVRAGRCERIEDWPWSGGLFAEAETYG